jgi:hypothetical protein
VFKLQIKAPKLHFILAVFGSIALAAIVMCLWEAFQKAKKSKREKTVV